MVKAAKTMLNGRSDKKVKLDLPPYRMLANILYGNEGPMIGFPFSRTASNRNKNERELAVECGYAEDSDLTSQWYYQSYKRWGISARVVDLWPDECWAVYPEIYETEDKDQTPFEKVLTAVARKTLAFHYLHRIDRLSGIGQFGILLLGLDDGGDLSTAPPGINPITGERKPDATNVANLNYIRAFDQTLVKVQKFDSDFRSPRYGFPTVYSIQFESVNNTDNDNVGGVNPPTASTPRGTQKIHWTRIIHVADNCMASEIFGVPRQRPVADYLHDIRKVAGSSAEMFFKGGFPGYAFEAYPDQAGDPSTSDEEIAEQMLKYQRGFQRYLSSFQGKWNSLQPQVANPDKHLDWYVTMICATIGVPKRIFLGSESGQLASTQDDTVWRARCTARQKVYLEPKLLRPFVDRLIALGVLPKPQLEDYTVQWRDLRALSDKERAEIALKKLQALMQYTTGNVGQVIPVRSLLTLIMGMTEEEADAVQKELKANPFKPYIPPVQAVPGGSASTPPSGKSPGSSSKSKPGGGARKGNAPKAKVGKPKTGG